MESYIDDTEARKRDIAPVPPPLSGGPRYRGPTEASPAEKTWFLLSFSERRQQQHMMMMVVVVVVVVTLRRHHALLGGINATRTSIMQNIQL